MHGADLAEHSLYGEEGSNVHSEGFPVGDCLTQKIESREPGHDERRSGRLDGAAAEEQEAEATSCRVRS